MTECSINALAFLFFLNSRCYQEPFSFWNKHAQFMLWVTIQQHADTSRKLEHFEENDNWYEFYIKVTGLPNASDCNDLLLIECV